MFRFKQFKVNDDGATMKVGTDAVLLGALTDSQNATSILDIGTGCGVVALIMAQHNSSATIHAIDNDARSVACAQANFACSPWSDRLSAFLCPVQDFSRNATQNYDCIVSNPPYFRRSLKSPSEKRNMARHADTLPPDELAASVSMLLSAEGTFSAILPCHEADSFIATAKKHNLWCRKEIVVFSKSQNNPLRKVIVLGRTIVKPVSSHITIYNDNNKYSEHYRNLTADLYLW